MIIWIIIISTISFTCSWLMIENRLLRLILGIISTFCFVASISLTSLNLTNHFGMKTVITSKETPIYSSASSDLPINILIAQELGEDSNQFVLIYRDTEDATEASVHFKPDENNMVESIKKTSSYQMEDIDQATLSTTEKKWVWENKFYEALFSFDNSSEELISQENIAYLSKDNWLVLTPQQAETFAEKQKNISTEEKEKQLSLFQAKLNTAKESYIASNPSASTEEIKEYLDNYLSKLYIEMIKSELDTAAE